MVRGVLVALVCVGVALGLAAVVSDRSAMNRPESETITPSATTTATQSTVIADDATSTPVRTAVSRPSDRPASYGEPLGAVVQPPPDTIVLVASNVASDGATYDTVFAPYGFSSRQGDGLDRTGGAGADALVIKVIDSTPRAGTGGGLVLSNRNLLVELAPQTLGKVAAGGQYSGSIAFVTAGPGLVPVLTTVLVARRR